MGQSSSRRSFLFRYRGGIAAKAGHHPPRRHSRSLRCEPLEERRLLSITVDTLVDEADGSIVDGDVSLRDALAVASAGETIDFAAALDGGRILLTLGELSITEAMTIDATSLDNGLTIDASGNDPTPDENNGDGSRVFNIDDGDDGTDSSTTISGLTLTGGEVIGDGGAIRTQEDLTVASSTISGNWAASSGGGIYARKGHVTIADSTISGNFALEAGGIWAAGAVTIANTTVSGNSVLHSGGGISAAGDVTVTSSEISGNSAGDGGGGVYAGGAVAVSSSTISGNSAGDGGGGIYTSGAVTISSSTISGNSALLEGGGISASGDVTVSSSTISGNSAEGYDGGGVFARHGDVTVISSTISGNSAVGGGGILARHDDVTVISSTISGNSAHGEAGGGISASGDVAVVSSTISGNSARSGGGIWAYDDVAVISSTISGNSAWGNLRSGGGILAYGAVTIANSTISGNSAHRKGGGIRVVGAVTVTSSTISGNSARGGIRGRGGGIYASGAVTVTSSTVSGNGAWGCCDWKGEGGGIWAAGDATVTIENSIVAGNTTDGSIPDISPGNGPRTVRYSLIGDNTGTGLAEAPVGMPDANGNLVGGPIHGIIDPTLGPLAHNGGTTETYALLAGSPAIDGGDPLFEPPPDFDQRDNPRVTDGDADGIPCIDMGSFEVLRGDMNGDGEVNGLDVDPFVEVLLVAGLAATADMNADGSVNGLDVDPFVVLVLGEHASTEAAGMGVAQHGRPVASATYDGMLAGMSIGSTLRRVHRTRPSHDAYQYGDPTHLIQHRAIEQIFARRSRMVTRIRGDGQRSPPADMIHDAQRVAAGRWHLAVDRAMRQDTDWDRFA